MATVVELPERFVFQGDNPTAEYHYSVNGADTERDAWAAVSAVAPIYYDINGDGLLLLPRVELNVEEMGSGYWRASVRWGILPQIGDASESIEIISEMHHVTHGLATVWSQGLGSEPAPAVDNGINLRNPGGVPDGIDINVPIMGITFIRYLPATMITAGWKGTIYATTAKVNALPYMGFLPGELLFEGAVLAERRQFNDWEVHYKFRASPNVSDAKLGPFTEVPKKGWEYAWAMTETTVDEETNVETSRVIAGYVEQLYGYADFSVLGL